MIGSTSFMLEYKIFYDAFMFTLSVSFFGENMIIEIFE